MKSSNRKPKGFGRQSFSHGRYVDAVIQNIQQCGQHVCSVYDPDNIDPSFFYTIGNSFASQPPVELFSFWKSGIGGFLLNCVSFRMKYDSKFCESVLSQEISYHWGFLGMEEETPIALRVVSGLLERIVRDKYVCQLEKEEFSEYVKPHQLIQVILPDMNGRFPGDPKFDEDFLEIIPEFLHLPYDPDLYSLR